VVPNRKVDRAPRRTFSRALLGQRARRRLHHAGLGAGRASLARSLGQARHKAVMARTKAHNRTAEQQAAWEAQEAADAREAEQEATEAAARRARRGRRASEQQAAWEAQEAAAAREAAQEAAEAAERRARRGRRASSDHPYYHTHPPDEEFILPVPSLKRPVIT
jgi:hypothetical protein